MFEQRVVRVPFKGAVPAVFLERKNRFVCEVMVGGKRELAHVPSSGRMAELLIRDASVWLMPVAKEGRKTAYDLLLVEKDGIWVSVDSRLPNAIVEAALRQGVPLVPAAYNSFRREVSYGGRRFDFLLQGEDGDCLVEVKSVTLVEDGVAKFPDAPTHRGAEHIKALVKAKERGIAAGIVFIIQREDARIFTPNWQQDPIFCSLLAQAQGIFVLAYKCTVSPKGVSLGLPVRISVANRQIQPDRAE
ncbi:MAG: DNA/RNA nuclease SfsA [Limnochordia bacterium]|jgi:sugar fermentation stimulation protein A